MWALKPTSWLLLAGEGELKFIIVLSDVAIFRIMAAFDAVFLQLSWTATGSSSISNSDAGGPW